MSFWGAVLSRIILLAGMAAGKRGRDTHLGPRADGCLDGLARNVDVPGLLQYLADVVAAAEVHAKFFQRRRGGVEEGRHGRAGEGVVVA